MTPANFPQANVSLRAPEGMTEAECGTLRAHRDGTHHISLWKLTWAERLRVIWTGQVWLWVWSPHTQPPVALDARSPWAKPDGKPGPWTRWRKRRKLARAIRNAVRSAFEEAGRAKP